MASKKGKSKRHHKPAEKARKPRHHTSGKKHKKHEQKKREYIKTSIKGLDDLFEHGMPKGASILVAGGAGSGKTILCLQILTNAAREGKKCLYMSFEEPEERLREHMDDFGWPVREFEKQGKFLIKRFSSFDIAKSIDALLAKERGELAIDYTPVVLPEGFTPDIVIVDSLSAISSAFVGKEDNYRSYVEQLFRYFERMDSTAFLITETEQIPTTFSRSGVEEFLADGVIVLYNIRKGNIRENAIEILKMRGAKHMKKIVAMQVLSGTGIEIFPEQEVFSKI